MADGFLDHIDRTALVPPGRYGLADGPPGVTLKLREDAALATIVARKGRHAAMQATGAALQGALPDGPHAAALAGGACLGLSPGRWLACSFDTTPQAWLNRLRGDFTDAAIADQSDAFLVVDLDGPRVRDLLAKGPAIDCDARAFPADACASTLMAHTAVTLWRVGGAALFRLFIPRSYAASLLRFLVASGAEYGIAVS